MTMDIKWRLKNLKTGDVVDISKSFFKVGRDSKADLTSRLIAMSRLQATFSILLDGQLYVQDHNSCNGTFINDAKIDPNEPKLLKHKDTIGFGCSQKGISEQKVSPDLLILIYEIIDETKNEITDDCNIDLTIQEDLPKMEFKNSESKTDESVLTKSKNGSPVKDNTFSQEEDFIIISDDEEGDNPFVCSQIFELSQRVKDEYTSLNESYDPYSEIKQELQDLDACEIATSVHVDLTDEFDHFDSTEALVDILETPRRAQNTTLDIMHTLENSSCKEVNKNIVETSGILENVEMGLEFCENKMEKSVDQTKDKVKGSVANISSDSSKYSKPIIVQPHTERKRSTSKDNNNEKSSKSKRKSTSKSDESQKKKLKSTDQDSNRNSLSKNSSSADPVNKTVIKEARITRLKEIALKNSPQNETRKTARNSETLDTSETGEHSLKEDLSSCSTPSKIRFGVKTRSAIKSNEEKPTDSAKSPNISKSSSKISKIESSENLVKPSAALVIKNDPRSIRRETRTRHVDNQAVHVQHAIHNRHERALNKIQDATISSNSSPVHEQSGLNEHKLHGAYATTVKSSSDMVWQSHLPRNANVILNHYRHLDNVDEYVNTIVHWSFRWVKEQWICDTISPPVSNKPPLMVPTRFTNFAKYADVFEPLVLLELWQFVFQTLHEERNHIQVTITHERRHGQLLYLDCECFYSDQDFKSNLPLRQEDFVLFEVICKSAEHTYQFTGFAFIKFCNRINNNYLAGPKSPNYKFTLITRKLDFQIIGNKMLVKHISNIGKILKLLKTINYLERSSLRDNILCPDSNLNQFQSNEHRMEVQNKLNQRQKEIVCEARDVCLGDKPGIYLINGPPGTGKSTVIMNIILEVIFKSVKAGKSPLILLTAPSNAAVDGLILKLGDIRRKFPDNQRHHLKIVRIGPDSSISDKVNKFKVNWLAINHLIKEHNISEMPEYREYHDRGMVDKLLKRKLVNNYQYELKRVEDLILFKSNVICTTLNSCVNNKILHPIRKGDLPPFTCCIIDEAAQCNELESLLPIQLGIERFVLVGDPMQLPAVVCNKQAQQLGYGRSLFSRMAENFKEQPKMLNEQYRMSPEICEYPNKAFYKGQLKSQPCWRFKLDPPVKPYLLFNLTNSQNIDTSDYVNTNEAHLICKILECLKQRIKTEYYSIGIIAPYKAQKDLLRTKISSIKFQQNVDVTVNTVDSFQGMENDVIIISCVRISNNYFLQNEQRLNVALTRAKQALYVVGNYSLFKECKPLYDLRENAKKRKLCIDIKENPKNVPIHKFIFQSK